MPRSLSGWKKNSLEPCSGILTKMTISDFVEAVQLFHLNCHACSNSALLSNLAANSLLRKGVFVQRHSYASVPVSAISHLTCKLFVRTIYQALTRFASPSLQLCEESWLRTQTMPFLRLSLRLCSINAVQLVSIDLSQLWGCSEI